MLNTLLLSPHHSAAAAVGLPRRQDQRRRAGWVELPRGLHERRAGYGQDPTVREVLTALEAQVNERAIEREREEREVERERWREQVM